MNAAPESERTVRLVSLRSSASILGAAVVIGALLWLTIKLAEIVIEGGTTRIDTAILLALRTPGDPGDSLGSTWFEEVIRDLSGLGGLGVLGLLVTITVGGLLLTDKHRSAGFLLATAVGGLIVSNVLKSVVNRPRPDVVQHGAPVYYTSFPSGHAMMSTVIYLTLGAFVTSLIRAKSLKLYVMAQAILLIVLIGLSRVYLGVHWPSDVLAGWTVGAAWVLGCWLVAKAVNARDGTLTRPATGFKKLS